jgi:hypothetical protein
MQYCPYGAFVNSGNLTSGRNIMFKYLATLFILSMLSMPAFAMYGLSNNSSAATSNNNSSGRAILRFDTMYAVNGPFVSHVPAQPTDPNIRDVLGDSLPWAINKSIKGVLTANGDLRIQVRGLVFTDRPNDEANFRALVSCQTVENNAIVVKNAITVPFPTGGRHNNPNLIARGNANIRARLTLPKPCIAPIVMILNGDGQVGNFWFAVTGF